MTTTTDTSVQEQGLLGRAFGVFFSPRATFAGIAARPKVLGALIVVTLVIAGTVFALYSTEFAQNATLDQQIAVARARNREMSEQQIAVFERFAPLTRYFAGGGALVAVPLVMALEALVFLVVFNAILGGEATFKQLYAIVAHSGFIGVLQQLFTTPLMIATQSITSGANLGMFRPFIFPFVPESSYLGHLLGNLDLFRIWGIITTSIGLGVLYKRKTAPIAWALFTVYALFALAYAGFQVMGS